MCKGLSDGLAAYAVYCHSAMGYVSQLAALNASIRHAEHRALQSLVRGPWQRIPTWLLKNLTVLGVPIRAPDLESMARAAAFRCAATSDVFSLPGRWWKGIMTNQMH